MHICPQWRAVGPVYQSVKRGTLDGERVDSGSTTSCGRLKGNATWRQRKLPLFFAGTFVIWMAVWPDSARVDGHLDPRRF